MQLRTLKLSPRALIQGESFIRQLAPRFALLSPGAYRGREGSELTCFMSSLGYPGTQKLRTTPTPEIRGLAQNFSQSHGPYMRRVLILILLTYFFIFLHISFIIPSYFFISCSYSVIFFSYFFIFLHIPSCFFIFSSYFLHMFFIFPSY